MKLIVKQLVIFQIFFLVFKVIFGTLKDNRASIPAAFRNDTF